MVLKVNGVYIGQFLKTSQSSSFLLYNFVPNGTVKEASKKLNGSLLKLTFDQIFVDLFPFWVLENYMPSSFYLIFYFL